MVTAYIGLGANLGDAAQTIRDSVIAVHALPQCSVRKISSLYKTAPLETLPGFASGGDYINAVVEVETLLTAPALLCYMHQLEQAAGRVRPYVNAPRTLDLDLLLYGDGRIDSPRLTVPHPRMWQRAFVLVPLAEIASEVVPLDSLRAVRAQAISRLSLLHDIHQ